MTLSHYKMTNETKAETAAYRQSKTKIRGGRKMQTMGKRCVFMLLTAVMVCGLFAALPQTAVAADTYTIEQTDSVEDIKTDIQGKIDGLGGSGTLVVDGGKTDANETLSLTIPAGVVIEWFAKYSEADAAPFTTISPMIELYGLGVFELAPGGSIETTKASVSAIGAYGIDMRVIGGTVKTSGSGGAAGIILGSGSVTVTSGLVESQSTSAIFCNTSLVGSVSVSGGTVRSSSTQYDCILMTNGDVTISGSALIEGVTAIKVLDGGSVTVSGGTIKSENGTAISTSFQNYRDDIGNITISGGTIEAGFRALYTDVGFIEITGGSVTHTGTAGAAIYLDNGGGAKITGGSVDGAIYTDAGVVAYLAGTCNGGFTAVNQSVIIEVDTLIVPVSRHGTRIGLTLKASDGVDIDGLSWHCYYTTPGFGAAFISGGGFNIGEWGSYDTAVPFAVIDNVTVSGTTGAALTEQRATVYTHGAAMTSVPSGTDVSSWFSNLPIGMTAITPGISAGAWSFQIIFGGIPSIASTEELDLTIPASLLTIGASLPVTSNVNAKFSIATPGGPGSSSSSAYASLNPSAATFDKTAAKDIAVTLTSGSYTLVSIKNGAYTLVSGTDYSVSGNVYTLKAAYLSKLPTGSQTISFAMSGGVSPALALTVRESAVKTSIRLTIGASSYTVDGVTKTLDAAPQIVGDRTMVPLRFIAEALGAKVDWDGDTQTVTIELDGKTLKVTIGVLAEGMDVPAYIANDRTMVPLRYISETLGCGVVWNPDTRSIDITK